MTQALILRDPVSAGTHLAAFPWAVFGAFILWRLCRSDRPKQLAMACFGISMAALYAASAAYHALRLSPEGLEFYRLLDHSAIFCLIAGTYTPAFFVLLKRPHREILLSVMWTLALAGIVWKWTLPSNHYPLTVAIYMCMGYVGFMPIIEMTRAVGLRAASVGILGGLLYTIGAILDLVGWPTPYPGLIGSHELLHVFVMGGTFCHFLFIARYVVPFPRQRSAPIALPSAFPQAETAPLAHL